MGKCFTAFLLLYSLLSIPFSYVTKEICHIDEGVSPRAESLSVSNAFLSTVCDGEEIQGSAKSDGQDPLSRIIIVAWEECHSQRPEIPAQPKQILTRLRPSYPSLFERTVRSTAWIIINSTLSQLACFTKTIFPLRNKYQLWSSLFM